MVKVFVEEATGKNIESGKLSTGVKDAENIIFGTLNAVRQGGPLGTMKNVANMVGYRRDVETVRQRTAEMSGSMVMPSARTEQNNNAIFLGCFFPYCSSSHSITKRPNLQIYLAS